MSIDKSKDALLNEYKGNLFEFLVAQHLSRINTIEDDYLKTITNDYSLMLSQQEEFIRNYYPDLLTNLPVLAQKLAKTINGHFGEKAYAIQMVGKSAASNKDVGEADIIYQTKFTQKLISIKLSKENSFVNTKSAGVKSFISKYFSEFTSAKEKQEELSNFFSSKFEEFSRRIHENYDIEYDSDFNSWILEAMPRLPGALKDQSRTDYLEFIYSVSNEIAQHLKSFLELDPSLFAKSILPLMGQSKSDIINATTFYKDAPSGLTSKQFVYSLNCTDFGKIIIDSKSDTTSLDIRLDSLILQVRVKCMNKFTSKSFKINCAVKHL